MACPLGLLAPSQPTTKILFGISVQTFVTQDPKYCRFHHVNLIMTLFQNSVGNLMSRSDSDIKFINLPKSRLQTSLFTHSDWNIIMSVIFSYKSHHRPVLLWVIGIKCDEFISAVFIQSINSDGINSSPYLLKASSVTYLIQVIIH
uniref:Uncharacterized protein n=1 Tax=Chrysemys picta bellii TaxID=8478 RepID=A0A8C3IXP0_CHRPI